MGANAYAATDTRTVSVYRSMLYPGSVQDPSGVRLRFVNRDSVSHRIVSYRGAYGEAWSLDITLRPGQSYTTAPFYCSNSNCLSKAYLFRDANRSSMVTSYGYTYCKGACGALWVKSDWLG